MTLRKLGCLIFVLSGPIVSHAVWLHDYKGTLGTSKIGMTIPTDELSQALGRAKTEGIHYYYTRHLKDISLTVKKQDGRDFVLEEKDPQGKLIATFQLTFATQDPKKRFVSKEDLVAEVLVGTWEPADKPGGLPVYLAAESSVWSDPKGGRCTLGPKSYAHLEERMQAFHKAAVKGDAATLRRDFKFTAPKSSQWEKEIVEAVPHNVFCNSQGFMLGNGIVWFDGKGNVKK